ncbi:hypothetical protein GCM10011374_36850 [Kocuria dechangensis]|uniref:Core-binding (CB) domain-containing protein n=1 Tax=Kocuria dechangensis TaxID=1176249 RepID=A0A917H6J7_9MICC|nr:site-specific integrase [Kocuria dechangensis]GGG69049.1 hypothetical protein GCM10011374_36850 [Kocuria dechangensis]
MLPVTPRPRPDASSPRPVVPRPHAHLVAGWLDSLASTHTRRTYRYALTAWTSWLQASQVDVLSARPTDVDVWRTTLTGAPATRAHKLSGMSSFCAYAVSQGALETNPFSMSRQSDPSLTVRRPKVIVDAPTAQGPTAIQARYLLGHAKKHGARSRPDLPATDHRPAYQ